MSYQSPYQQQTWQSSADAAAANSYLLQRQQDDSHLNLLAVFHYVVGGLTLLGGACVFVWFVLIGVLAGHGQTGDQAAAAMFLVMGIFASLVCFAVGGLKVWAGRCLQNKHGYTFATVMACIECLSVPLGTILGVCTLIVLSRPSVRAAFAGENLPPAVGPAYPAAPLPEDADWYRRNR